MNRHVRFGDYTPIMATDPRSELHDLVDQLSDDNVTRALVQLQDLSRQAVEEITFVRKGATAPEETEETRRNMVAQMEEMRIQQERNSRLCWPRQARVWASLFIKAA
jgi:hypothetical protein